MNKKVAYIGLDVHKNSITLALFEASTKSIKMTQKLSSSIAGLIKLLRKLEQEYSLQVCCEAGRP